MCRFSTRGARPLGPPCRGRPGGTSNALRTRGSAPHTKMAWQDDDESTKKDLFRFLQQMQVSQEHTLRGVQTRLGETAVRMAALEGATTSRFDLLGGKVDSIELAEGADATARSRIEKLEKVMVEQMGLANKKLDDVSGELRQRRREPSHQLRERQWERQPALVARPSMARSEGSLRIHREARWSRRGRSTYTGVWPTTHVHRGALLALWGIACALYFGFAGSHPRHVYLFIAATGSLQMRDGQCVYDTPEAQGDQGTEQDATTRHRKSTAISVFRRRSAGAFQKCVSVLEVEQIVIQDLRICKIRMDDGGVSTIDLVPTGSTRGPL